MRRRGDAARRGRGGEDGGDDRGEARTGDDDDGDAAGAPTCTGPAVTTTRSRRGQRAVAAAATTKRGRRGGATTGLWVSRSCWLPNPGISTDPSPAQSGPSLETGASTSCSFQAAQVSSQSLQLLGVLTVPAAPSLTNAFSHRLVAAAPTLQPSATPSLTAPAPSPHMPSHLLQPRSLALVAAFCPAALAGALAAALTLHPPRRPFTVVELPQVSLGALIPAGSFH